MNQPVAEVGLEGEQVIVEALQRPLLQHEIDPLPVVQQPHALGRQLRQLRRDRNCSDKVFFIMCFLKSVLGKYKININHLK